MTHPTCRSLSDSEPTPPDRFLAYAIKLARQFALRLVDEDAAEDAAQDVVIDLMERIRVYRLEPAAVDLFLLIRGMVCHRIVQQNMIDECRHAGEAEFLLRAAEARPEEVQPLSFGANEQAFRGSINDRLEPYRELRAHGFTPQEAPSVRPTIGWRSA